MILSSLVASKTVIKTVTLNQMLYSDKTFIEVKEIALKKAKQAAAREIYGEFLFSETVMVNGKILDDIAKEKTGGTIHIKGEPKFSNGENFGDFKVTIEAYATDDDIKNMSPQYIVLKNFTYSNPNIPIKDLKLAAEDAFIIEAIASKKPSARKASIQEVRKLALSIDITKSYYNPKKLEYTISGQVEYIPEFLYHAQIVQPNSISRYAKNEIIIHSSREKIKLAKHGFYGLWNGFVMNSNGSSMDLDIEILDSGLTSISYNSLKCGGDLIIYKKTTKFVIFKEKITYGKNICKKINTIKLKKINDEQLLFIQFDEDGDEIAKGSLYRND
jgi:hypothetical protein